jgi:hypothetical protein
MLTDPEPISKVDQIWDRLWSSGLSNPMDSIEQFSYLLKLVNLQKTEGNLQSKQRGKPQLSHLTNAEPFVKALVAEHPDANAGRAV